jgi:hypothetical protein
VGREKSPSGLSVGAVIGLSALVGVVAGLALANRHQSAELSNARLAEAVDHTLPVGVPLRTDQSMMAPDPRALAGLPPYPGAEPRRMLSGTTEENGVGAVAWFQTDDPLETVLGYYERALSQKVVITSNRLSERRGYVAWLEAPADDAGLPDLDEATVHMVSVSDEGSQRMVFVSANQPQKMLAAARELPGGVRLPEWVTAPQVIRTGEVGQERATIFAIVDRPVAELHRALAALLEHDGWQVATTELEEGQGSIVATRNDVTQVDALKKGPDGTELFVTVEQHPAPSAHP